MIAEIVPIHTPALFQDAVRRAADLLRAGKLVALPTETVYGLAANALNPEAVASIFSVKERPPHNPIIVHIATLEMARQCVREWPQRANRFVAAFWPGPLTLVLPKAECIPSIVTAGGSTVGVRWPSHPFAQAVIRECGFPLAAPSANPSSHISATTAAHVHRSLGEKIPLIVDGGPTRVGIESTVLDLTGAEVRVLRPGMINAEYLLAMTGQRVGAGAPLDDCTLKSPGLLRKHYSPQAPLVLCRWSDPEDLKARLGSLHLPLERVHVLARSEVPRKPGFGCVHSMAHDPTSFAQSLYAELHACDEAGAQMILVEAPPETELWRAITDRLEHAAAKG